MIGWAATNAYRLVIHLYPQAFRDSYGEQMLHDFVARGEHAIAEGSRRAAWAGWTRSIITDATAGIGMRLKTIAGREIAPQYGQQSIGRSRSLKSKGKYFMGDVIRDLQYSARMLIKNPLFTVAAVVTLALGIGLNAATFSTVNGLLLRPLGGVSEPEELVLVYRRWAGIEYGSNSIPHYQSAAGSHPRRVSMA